jgi:hypothetical protein
MANKVLDGAPGPAMDARTSTLIGSRVPFGTWLELVFMLPLHLSRGVYFGGCGMKRCMVGSGKGNANGVYEKGEFGSKH